MKKKQNPAAHNCEAASIKKDIAQIKKAMATKKELGVIKNDLEEVKKNMVTKKELEEVKNNMATKKELEEVKKNMATKDVVDKLVLNVIKLQEDMDEIKSYKIKEKMDIIISMLDANTKERKDHEEAHAVNQAAHDRFENKLKVIEKNLSLDLTAQV